MIGGCSKDSRAAPCGSTAALRASWMRVSRHLRLGVTRSSRRKPTSSISLAVRSRWRRDWLRYGVKARRTRNQRRLAVLHAHWLDDHPETVRLQRLPNMCCCRPGIEDVGRPFRLMSAGVARRPLVYEICFTAHCWRSSGGEFWRLLRGRQAPTFRRGPSPHLAKFAPPLRVFAIHL
jgi:hypothetical protein